MPHAKARWVDQNGRSHEWSGYVATTDRNQVISQISAQTGAKSVVVSGVYNDDPGSFETKRKQHVEEERERFRIREEKLKENGKLKYFPEQPEKINYSRSSDSSDFSGTGSLVALMALLWVAFTFLPWFLMFIGGAVGTWVGQFVTGQSVDEYNSIDDPTDGEHIRALILFVLALSLGGWGFVQGTIWQREAQTDTTPKVEQVKPK